MEGIVLRSYSSFYYVYDDKGKVWECKLRGVYRLNKKDVLAGDKVIFTKLNDEQGVIEEILPRKNELYRPRIANVDQLIIVSALKEPAPDLVLIDRLTVLAGYNNLKPVIIFNKSDLVKEESNIINEYKKIGFDVLTTSVKENKGIENIKEILSGKLSVFAGASGVGKSSILNAILPKANLEVGSVSSKLKRGRHTTRRTEIFILENGGLVADTPGFSRLNLPKSMTRENLGYLFPEFVEKKDFCKFSNCLHKNEPNCSIKEEVEKGEIADWRYENYLQLLEEVIGNERSY